MIKLVLLDVDGTLTDGGVYHGNDGNVTKKFNVKDGYIIANARKAGIDFGIVTGGNGKLLEYRAKKLKMKYLFCEVEKKEDVLTKLMEETGLKMEEIAYMGDDLNDINIIKKVGFSGAPADAVDKVLEIVDFVCAKKGGNGAVREFVETILKKENLYEKFLEICLI